MESNVNLLQLSYFYTCRVTVYLRLALKPPPQLCVSTSPPRYSVLCPLRRRLYVSASPLARRSSTLTLIVVVPPLLRSQFLRSSFVVVLAFLRSKRSPVRDFVEVID
ncbi:hypothetical protein U1Q18_016302 [Sarracenia purpurea var. burkii]